MNSIFVNNFFNFLNTITSNPFNIIFYTVIAFLITYQFYFIETIFHELGHVTATTLSYLYCKIRHKINHKLNITINIKISHLKLGKENETGCTISDFIDFLNNSIKFIPHKIHITIGGILYSSIYFFILFVVFIIYLPPESWVYVLTLIIFFFFVLNLLNFFAQWNKETSDLYKIITFTKEIKMIHKYKKAIKENTKLKKQELNLKQKEWLKTLNNSKFNSIDIQNKINELKKENQTLKNK